MATPLNQAPLQEVAPSSGYPSIDVRRRLPIRRGPHGAFLWLGFAACAVGGFALVHKQWNDKAVAREQAITVTRAQVAQAREEAMAAEFTRLLGAAGTVPAASAPPSGSGSEE